MKYSSQNLALIYSVAGEYTETCKGIILIWYIRNIKFKNFLGVAHSTLTFEFIDFILHQLDFSSCTDWCII